jgi:hypothetical protein
MRKIVNILSLGHYTKNIGVRGIVNDAAIR